MGIKVDDSALRKKLSNIAKGLDAKFAERMGIQLVLMMRQMIAKGISPIEGNGRFPEYKAVNESRQIKKANKTKGLAGKLARASLKIQGIGPRKRPGYPESVRDKFPDKKNRPVNLFLSGEFLNNLTFGIVEVADKFAIKLGFFDELSVQKERGHRYKANKQPSRPIVPIGSEKLAKRLLLLTRDLIREQIKKSLEK